MEASALTCVYIAGGRLYAAGPDASVAELNSAYLQRQLDRIEQDRSRSAWKNDSFGWNLTARGQVDAMSPYAGREGRFTSVAEAGAGEVVYTLESNSTGGLFQMSVSSCDERRLFHKQDIKVCDVAVHPKTGMLAMACRSVDGTGHIALLNPGGGGIRAITEGDVVDGAPTWAPGGGERGCLLYHSSGVARTAEGAIRALGPSTIYRLDLDADRLETVLESSTADYLLPRVHPDGALYCIRRPYQPYGPTPSPLQVAKDIVLFPVRLGVAVVHFLNAFSLLFSKQPLITSGGPKMPGVDQRPLMLWGRWMDAQRMMREQQRSGAIVPKNWELVRRGADGSETVIAQNVVAFDIARDGSVVWTNGYAIFRSAGGRNEKLARGTHIERIAVISQESKPA